jgi:hypothetical protein
MFPIPRFGATVIHNMNNLTFKQAEELGGALARLAELGESKIVTKEIETERAALQRFVATTATEHITDLLGAWFTVRRQYEPLLLTIAGIAKQVGGILQQQPKST